MTALSANELGVAYDGTTILHGITLDILPGEVLALVGPNGAGKSTLLGALAGDVPAAHGSVTLDGKPVRSYRPIELARHRAVLTQENQVSFSISGRRGDRDGPGALGRHHRVRRR